MKRGRSARHRGRAAWRTVADVKMLVFTHGHRPGRGATLRMITTIRATPGRDALMNPPTTTAVRPEAGRSRRARLRSWRSLSLTLPADRPDLLAVIRRLVHAHALDSGAQTAKAEEIELCVSELLTNALRYSDGPARLELAVHGATVLAAVSDTSTHAPGEPGPASSATGEHGRGLHIVNKLANTVEVRVYQWGKTVTVSFLR